MKSHEESLIVALDAEHTRQSAAGIARYARGLIAALRKRGDVSVLELGGGDVARRDTFRKRATTLRQDFLWYPWLGRRRAAAARADIYHVPLPRGPITRGSPPLVVTVHDLASLRFPESITPWSRIYSRLTLRRILGSADRILTPSADTANDLATLLKIPSERIRVVYNGVDDFFLEKPIESGKSPLRGDGPYVLFVGTPEPRKNLDRLVAAMALLRKRGAREHLVIAGGGGWGQTHTDGPGVRRLGRVSDSDLRDLYANASCLALPSLHEGFGLPAVEAMAAGTPVVASRTGALPEITAGAAVLVDPLSITGIADGIAECIADRASLSVAGRERAKQFTWERSAAGTMAVYRELA